MRTLVRALSPNAGATRDHRKRSSVRSWFSLYRPLLILILAILLGVLTGSSVFSQPSDQIADPGAGASAGVAIANVTASTSSVPLYDKFELSFDIQGSAASNLQFPYDPAPPPGLVGRTGISAEGLFLPPGASDWSQAKVVPGFLFQDYDRQLYGNQEWLYPRGNPVWKVRFAATAQGTWQYKLRAQDASICAAGVNPCPNWAESAAGTFTVSPANPGNRGFVRVSESDSRYFAFSDGSPFVGLGHNAGFSDFKTTYSADSKLSTYAANGASFFRVWMSTQTIAGSAWNPWSMFGDPYYGYIPDSGLQNAPSGGGYDFAFQLDQGAGKQCIVNGKTQGNFAVKPGTTYKISVRAMVSGVTGPRNSSYANYGLTLKEGGTVSSCPDGLLSNRNLVPYLKGSSGWTTLESSYTTGSTQNFMGWLYLMLDNASAGQAYIGEVSMREVRPDGSLGPNIMDKSRGDMHMDFNQQKSWAWDYMLEQAAAKGVYLKLVVLEKNDRVWNRLNGDGSLGTSDTNNNNFYSRTDFTKSRRLQEYYWRYLAARWGYSTAVHSWELLNEGDPNNGYHHAAANAFARRLHEQTPAPHLATTSFWHSFPVKEVWGNSSYPHLDYADLHAYISTGGGNYEWSAPSNTALETNTANTYEASTGAIRIGVGVSSGAKTIPIKGQGDWRVSVMVKAQGISGSCPNGVSSSLAGPQLLLGLDGASKRVIPYNPAKPGDTANCTAPAGTYGYQKFEGTLPVPDGNWHNLSVTFKNNYASAGTAWFDQLTIESPDGRLARVHGDGTFDDRYPMDLDSAWYTESYSLRHGGPSGPGKPVVRGEAGLDYPDRQSERPELANDTRGVWLHNYLWAQLNPGGMYDLYWWVDKIKRNNLYFQFKPLSDFLGDIPIDNGRYEDARAVESSSSVRATGQVDRAAGRAHLWVRNTKHTWWNVVNGVASGRLNGTVEIPGFLAGSYPVEYWTFDSGGNLSKLSGTLTADSLGYLVIDLAQFASSVTDLGVKIGTYDGYVPLFPMPTPTPTLTPTPIASPTPAPSPSPVTLFGDGFESANYSAWSVSGTATGGTLGVSTARSDAGSYSSRHATSGTTNARAYAYKTFTAPSSKAAYLQGKLFLSSLSGTAGNYRLLHLDTSGGQMIATAQVNSSGGLSLYMKKRDGAEYWGAATPISLGNWHTLEVGYDWSGTPTASLYLDGQLVDSYSDGSSGTTLVPARAYVDGWSKNTTISSELYWDAIRLGPDYLGGWDPAPLPTATPTAVPTATLVPNPTATPTLIPDPTATQVPPTATALPSATAAPLPSATPTPLPTATETPTPTPTPKSLPPGKLRPKNGSGG